MPRVNPNSHNAPACAQCSRSCNKHAEHWLHRIYGRDPNFAAIGWECRECGRFWRDPEGDIPTAK